MRKKELLREIEALNARIKHLEECIKTQDRLLEGYQKREHGVMRAMQQVQENADRRLAEAEEKAKNIEHQAKQESSRLLAQTEATAAEYRDAIERYNAALEYAAAEAAANAERFAAFARGRKLAEGEIAREAEGLSGIPYCERLNDLPDPQDDPAQLMQNIYRIQNRILPEEPEEELSSAEEAPRDVAEPQPERMQIIEDEVCAVSPEEALIESFMEEDFREDDETAAPPTVNGVLESRASDFENTQELSLDDLLDEIIKSGEQYHG